MSKLIVGDKVEFDIIEKLVLDSSDLLDCLPIALVIESCEVETCPFWK